MKDLSNLAEIKEAEEEASGEYTHQWKEIARFIKEKAGWKCERCNTPHGNCPNVLTVHHLDGNKKNMHEWNLAALCQRCHLRIQSRVDWFQDSLDGIHSEWLAVNHIIPYNEYAKRHNLPVLKLTGIVKRNYDNEWTR